ncbi:hypothetical protein MKX01_042660 [Papaver californicum]|nr:hypothetical protein MKX01_042660 [Papaver californicum]
MQDCMEITPRFHMRSSINKYSQTYCPKCITKHIATKVEENITLIMCQSTSVKRHWNPISAEIPYCVRC